MWDKKQKLLLLSYLCQFDEELFCNDSAAFFIQVAAVCGVFGKHRGDFLPCFNSVACKTVGTGGLCSSEIEDWFFIRERFSQKLIKLLTFEVVVCNAWLSY